MNPNLKRAWWANPAPIEAMSAMMALAFALILIADQTVTGIAQHGSGLTLRLFWGILSIAASAPYFYGVVMDLPRWRNGGLLAGVTFWSLVTASLALEGDARAVLWSVYTGFVVWAYLRRSRDDGRRTP